MVFGRSLFQRCLADRAFGLTRIKHPDIPAAVTNEVTFVAGLSAFEFLLLAACIAYSFSHGI